MESKRWNSSLRVRRYDNHARLAELSSATNVVVPRNALGRSDPATNGTLNEVHWPVLIIQVQIRNPIKKGKLTHGTQ